ncbi:hypothetical protein GGR52DRAFT_543312 [Hypoxylon sp. FL1284]|nr:hypothetical protein GGR52DRAFT_543312 [Hypoxylon sp. FL1284]
MWAQALTHARTVWLFMFSDPKTIIVPSFIFGIANAIVAPKYLIPGLHTVDYPTVIYRAPLVLFWVVLNYLPFAINNQRSPLSITEDSVNKPWRPIPSGRLSASSAKTIMLALYFCAPLFSILGGMRQCVGLIALGSLYNNFSGAENPIARNTINALGYICFISGAMEVAVGSPLPLTSSYMLPRWLATIAGIIITTVHAQDMYDQPGDSLRNRRTIPLVIGDGSARWTIAVWVPIWGLWCPHLWNSAVITRAIGVVLAGIISFRTLTYRNVPSDRTTFLIWNVWVSFVYMLPLFG